MERMQYELVVFTELGISVVGSACSEELAKAFACAFAVATDRKCLIVDTVKGGIVLQTATANALFDPTV